MTPHELEILNDVRTTCARMSEQITTLFNTLEVHVRDSEVVRREYMEGRLSLIRDLSDAQRDIAVLQTEAKTAVSYKQVLWWVGGAIGAIPVAISVYHVLIGRGAV